MVLIGLAGFVGYLLAYNVFVKKDNAFFPVIYVAFASILMYLAGFIGNLNVGVYAVTGIGIAFIPVSLIFKDTGAKELFKRSFCTPMLLYMAIGICWALVTARSDLYHADDFNHWYRICKGMYYDNAFPVTPEINFRTYVPGTACWITYVCRLLSFKVSNCFFAQSLIDLSCCCTLLASISSFSRTSDKVTAYVGASILSVLLCSLNLSTYCLLVDCTLGLLTLACAVYLMRNDFEGSWVLALLFTYIVLVKNSGILLVLFVVAFWMVFGKGVKKKQLVLSVLIPVAFALMYVIWGHVHFTDIAVSDQSASVTRFSSLVSAKSSDLILQVICDSLIKSLPVIGMTSQINLFWVSIVAVYILERKSKSKKLTVYLLSTYYIYLVFLIGTYLFSMDNAEAFVLACYYRYMGTVSVFLCGIALYKLLSFVGFPRSIALVSVMVPICCLLGASHILGFKTQTLPYEAYDSRAWAYIREYASENTSYSSLSYVVIWDDEIKDSDGYGAKVQALSEAFLRSENVYILTYNGIDQVGLSDSDIQKLEESDVLIVVGEVDGRLDPVAEYTVSGTLSSGENEGIGSIG